MEIRDCPMDILCQFCGVLLRVLGVRTTGNAVFMAWACSGTVVPIQCSHNLGDASGNHPRLLKILILLPSEA